MLWETKYGLKRKYCWDKRYENLGCVDEVWEIKSGDKAIIILSDQWVRKARPILQVNPPDSWNKALGNLYRNFSFDERNSCIDAFKLGLLCWWVEII